MTVLTRTSRRRAEIMAVPKRRTSRSKKGTRRSHHHVTPVQIQYCPRCNEPVLPHRVCSQLRLLPGPRRHRGGRRKVREVTHADRAGRDGRRPRPGPERGRRRPRRRQPRPISRSSSSATRPSSTALVAAGESKRHRPPRDRPRTRRRGHEGEAGRGASPQAGRLHHPLLATARREEGRRPRQRRQHRRGGRRRAADGASSSSASTGPASPP